MSQRKNVSSGSKWEPLVGYSRAVRVGNIVHVAGTVASDEAGNLVGAGNAQAQAAYILQKIERYLKSAGASMQDVVRTRMYVTDAALWEEIGRAHHAVFHEILPVATLVEVSVSLHRFSV